MITKLYTAVTYGLEAQKIEVEMDAVGGLPNITMVGLGDKAVQESKERIRSALKHSGFEQPQGKLTVNLAPADIVKSGSQFDVPIAVGMLHIMGSISVQISDTSLFLGELSLDGTLRPITGTLTVCLWARQNGFSEVFIPADNGREGSMVSGITVYAIESVKQLVDHLNGTSRIEPVGKQNFKSDEMLMQPSKNPDFLFPNDFAYVKGQEMAKRALEIAAAGGHNVLFIGQPGSGKTLLARAYPTILPGMTEEEILEATQIYSVAGLLGKNEVVTQRPFRAPHHSSSHIALVGGGSRLRPGEISLAHRGVLFLDEFPEFSRETIEVLRQPLEDGHVTISRASGSVTYPSRFYLLAAANPTPSGFDPNDPDAMNKPQNRSVIARYQAKFSGPMLDRIDLQVDVNRPAKEELKSEILAERSVAIATRVQAARDIQTKRFAQAKIHTNAEMSLPMIQHHCKLDAAGDSLLSKATDQFKLSARSYMRILKLSRTIADLAASASIQPGHVAEALQFRGRWG